jgi:hypothetical protein
MFWWRPTRKGGALARFGIAPVAKPTQLKAKVLSIWNEIHEYQCIMDDEVINLAIPQLKECEAAKSKEESNREKGKQDQEQLQNAMKSYQCGLGALPPRAKGTQGAGRMKHSTNTRLLADEH